MASFKTLMDAQVAALTAAAAKPGSLLTGVGFVEEDQGNITAMLAEKLAELGMVVLIGVPPFTNETLQAPRINGKVEWQILVREFAEVWRSGSGSKAVCSDVALAVAAALQQLRVPGWGFLRVLKGIPLGAVRPDEKKRIEFQDYRLDLEAPLVT